MYICIYASDIHVVTNKIKNHVVLKARKLQELTRKKGYFHFFLINLKKSIMVSFIKSTETF